MAKKEKAQTPPKQKSDIEPGNPEYRPGETGTPNQPVYDEDAEAEKRAEKKQPPTPPADEEDRKIVNEQEQNQVINDDESTGTPQQASSEKSGEKGAEKEQVYSQKKS